MRSRQPAVAATLSAVDHVYLDYNATTPLDPGILAALQEVQAAVFANPSSPHALGRRARCLLDDCRERVAAAWRAKPSEVAFTGSATESNNQAILGTARARRDRGRHLISSQVEHPSVLAPLAYLQQHEGFEVTLLPVDHQGRIAPSDLRQALRADTTLVSLQAANNEIGTLQPVDELGALCRERGVLFHVDAVQWFGKMRWSSIADFNADLVSCCAHKLHGPKGAGALYVRSPFRPHSLLHGGSQEEDRRAGTENLPAILGLTLAMEQFLSPPVFASESIMQGTRAIREFLVAVEGVVLMVEESLCLPNTVAVAVAGCDSLSLLAGLDLEGFCASSGSACSSGALQSSRVVRALGYSEDLAGSLVRLSLGRETSGEAIERLLRCLLPVIKRVQGARQPAVAGE
ncbi:MAG: cysteine desulfurase [Verrucomicrobiales bacterium]|nr:cysteine desulfurase [Verrucomicrobiales bacterium]